MSKKLNTSLVAIRTLKMPGPPGAGQASRPPLKEASISDNLLTPASPLPPNHAMGQSAAMGSAASDTAFQLLAPRNAHDLFTEALDAVRIVLNRALYFHHTCLRRTCSPPVCSCREADDISSCFHVINESSIEQSQHALPIPLHFLCGNCRVVLVHLIIWIPVYFGAQAGGGQGIPGGPGTGCGFAAAGRLRRG